MRYWRVSGKEAGGEKGGGGRQEREKYGQKRDSRGWKRGNT